MIEIRLPDGTIREYCSGISSLDVAQSIGSSLAKAAVAARHNGALVDLCDPIAESVDIEIVTVQEKDGLDVLRHSCAHLFGHALKQIIPDAKMVIGPVIDNGFYYDVLAPKSLTPDDLTVIEERMRTLAKTGYQVCKRMTSRKKAREVFTSRGETFKVRLLDELPADIHEVGLYYHQEYVDMCRGPHVPNMRSLKAFRLTHLAGSYWRGDANNEVLQRVYGVCFATQKELDTYLEQVEEAKKRDHRLIGQKLDLFHTSEEAPGMVFWHADGTILYDVVTDYLRQKLRQTGFREVRTPQVLDISLWKKSGHFDKFREDMFFTGSEKRDYAIKPMNCPGHVQLYNQQLHSYRDLPLRLAEFGLVHRNEASGTLHGLMRLRGFTQDDSHIFCTEQQIREEVQRNCAIIFDIYRDFGFTDIDIKLSTRPQKRIGSDAIWDSSEKALADALNAINTPFSCSAGEGAFYGPKLEFSLTDAIGRVWQCGTIQVDFSMPERLEAMYIDASGDRQTPVMLHRAVLGSIERFLGVLLEHYAGFLPLWLAPVQVVVATITDNQKAYAKQVQAIFQGKGIRARCDLRNQKIGYKIRELGMQHIPYVCVVGGKEKETSTVNVRDSRGIAIGTHDCQNFADILVRHVHSRQNSFLTSEV